MKFKKLMLSLSLLTAIGLSSCGNNQIKVNPDKKEYVVGISQLVQHEALDQATLGFKDSLKEELAKEGRTVKFLENNAQGDSANCITIANTYVAKDVDLIMANATASLQAAYNATTTIPILGTSITEYGTALQLENFNGLIGNNTSGTSDLAPLEKQATLIKDLFSSAKKVGLLYCSSEPNSLYQVKVMEQALAAKNIETKRFTFTDSNDIYNVALAASLGSDVIYVPTDNVAASNAKLIDSACRTGTKKTPVICGEEGPAKICGVATITISYYDLGVTTGKMAASVLLGKEDITKMEIRYAQNSVKKYNKTLCEEFGLTLDSSFVEMK